MDKKKVAASKEKKAQEVQTFFELLGLKFKQADKQEKLVDVLGRVVWLDFIEEDLVRKLSKDDAGELNKLLMDKASDEKLAEFIKSKVPNIDELLKEKVVDLREDLLRERIEELMEKYKGDGEKMRILGEAQMALDDGRWGEIASKLAIFVR